MLKYPHIDPNIITIGPLKVRWYGLMYVIGFVSAYVLVRYQAQQFGLKRMVAHLDNCNLALIVGVILGGRLGYVLFYNLSYYLQHPLEILATWEGGMSFHGGCTGALLAGLWYCHRQGLDFWQGADLYVVTVPIGLGLGRLGNFINGELFGRVTTMPWGMIFPDGGPWPRHPSQLYEAFCEGVVLFVILWCCRRYPWQSRSAGWWPHGSLLALFLLLYGSIRFGLEFFREPDPQLGTLLFSLSMGQWLSMVMIVLGAMLWWWRKRKAACAS